MIRSYLKKESYVDFIFYQPVKSAITSGFVIFFILYFFEPFNIHLFSSKWKIIIALIYATIPTIIYMLIFKFSYSFLMKFKNRWTNKLEMTFFIFIFFVSSFIVYFYSSCLSYLFPKLFNLGEGFLVLSFGYTYSIGFVIYMVLKLMDHLTHFKMQVEVKDDILRNIKSKKIIFRCNYVNDKIIALESASILYIESNKNMINIFFKEDNYIKNKSIRKTLKEVEDQLHDYKEFFKCHKSYIINKTNIDEVIGNSRYAYAILKTGNRIPISRTKMYDMKVEFENYAA